MKPVAASGGSIFANFDVLGDGEDAVGRTGARLAWHQSLPFAFFNCLAALPIRALVPDRTFAKIAMVSESWSRAHTLRAVIMTYGNSIILFTPSTPSYTAT